ncbi:MAG: redox-sensing transcriptional repressor Rex [Candidatus Zixiibacteriota bacterium]|nr:MAG: redox-sensing transcriptional repressor Rex [candidate division Zixibacteria bacterium]
MNDRIDEITNNLSRKRISESTIRRLSLYYRALSLLEKEGYETVSSKELAKREKLTPAQVRKDLSFFGSFGTRGLGYPVAELRRQLAAILGIDRQWQVALIGVGNIGSALVGYKEFVRQGFQIVKLFDNDQRKIGSNHKGIVVSDIADLESELKADSIEMVVIAVPATVAQYIVDDVVNAGIKAILNFAPVNLRVPSDVYLRNENMSMELEYLSFAIVNQHAQKRVRT